MPVRIGDAVPRKEDLRLLTGRGRYADDLRVAGLAHAAFVRSPHAHAGIRAIAVDAARAMPGVLAVLTGADAAADGLGPIPHLTAGPLGGRGADIALTERPGTSRFVPPHLPLPLDRARFVGEAVAMVVAETAEGARDGAEAVEVDYAPLPAVTDAAEAAAPGAPLLYEGAASNLALEAEVGDPAATAAGFAAAAHVVRLETWIQRVTGAHLEPRSVLAEIAPATGRLTLHAAGGTGVVWLRGELARVLGMPEDMIRVVAGDVGGNFGTRNAFYPEFALVAWAARRLGRAVRHTADRGEAMASDYQARDLRVEAELALDADGRFLALRTRNLSNVGAHAASFTPLHKGVELMTGVYAVPAASVVGRAVMSNTPSTVPYRSAGRPEAMFVIERLIDRAARATGIDRVALRRRNLIPAAAMPFRTALGLTYDSGDYAEAMNQALALADWAGFPARRAEARARGRWRGIGLANYVECTSGLPRERAALAVRPDGTVELRIGTLSTGQGHETSFAQLVADWLGVAFEAVRVVEGDSDRVEAGGGSHSGRSMRIASIVIHEAVGEIVAAARRRAAARLEADEVDLELADGAFRIRGTDRVLALRDLAPLEAVVDRMVGGAGFPYGSHVCEVEIDPETGVVEVVGYAAVDDVGRAVNPPILHGQSHGGIAQGLGQALLEQCVHEPGTGQLLTGSFLDYAMPRADHLPSFRTLLSEVPAASHPLGIRPGGEGGTTPSLAAAINAIVDALSPLDIGHVEMPATPERVWRAIRDKMSRAAG